MNKMSKYSDVELLEILNNFKSMREVILFIGYKSATTGSYNLVKKECSLRGLEIPKYNYFGDGLNDFNQVKYTNEEVFCEHSTYSRHSLIKRIIKDDLLEYKCSECGNIGEWNGKKLSLQLEHINGIHDDNRLNNLTFLCPNCHTQTKTYGGKSLKKHHYCICGNEKTKRSKQCIFCSNNEEKNRNRKVERPKMEIILNDIKELGYTGTGRKYGVSDNAIRKWIK